MTEDQKDEEKQTATERQPIFLLPGVVSAFVGLLIAIHALAGFLSPLQSIELTYWFAFAPLRFVVSETTLDWLPLLWTPFTHAFLHASWEHVLINAAWLAIFATPVTRRYGALAMILLFLISAAAGAAAFTATSLYDGVFLVGASGGVAGLTGAAVRFIFQPPIVVRDPETGEHVLLGRRLASLGEVFRNPRSRWFTLIWVGINLVVPLMPLFAPGMPVLVAWQAHLGGFFAGLLLVPLFERRT